MFRKSVYFAITFIVLTATLIVYDRTANAGTVTFEPLFDSCRNVQFKVTNERNVAIEIKQIKYYNASKGKWKTEDIGNLRPRCERGGQCVVGSSLLNYKGEDLADAEGDRLTKFVFVYTDVNSNTIRESQQFEPSDPVCRAEKVYGLGQGWTITGMSDAGNSGGSSGIGDACKNVSFLVKNETKYSSIYITKVKYYNRNSKKWKTEDVKEHGCYRGITCTVGGQDDLLDAKDDDITSIVFIYNYFLPGQNLKRSENKESRSFNPSSPTCREGKVFGTGQGWTIK